MEELNKQLLVIEKIKLNIISEAILIKLILKISRSKKSVAQN